MSAIAQIIKSEGHSVTGSDRSFDNNQNLEIKEKLQNMGIKIYPQDSSGLSKDIDFFVVSTAVEEDNIEYRKAKELNLKILHRSQLLSKFVLKSRTIAVAGTSGKSTTTALIWHILNEANLSPSVINGAYINSLISSNLIGNAFKGKSDILVIEADESDSTIVNYKPEIGVVLNITKDHKDIGELKRLFSIFISNSKKAFINKDDKNCMEISRNNQNVFYFTREDIRIKEIGMFSSRFSFKDVDFELPLGGYHNIENALSAIAVSSYYGISLKDISKAIKTFKGTFRRFNLIGEANNIKVIDDYAHNPAKIEATLKTLTISSSRVIAIYQPHGYTPTRLFKEELKNVFINNLRENDVLIMPEIYYAGGNVIKDISSKDLIEDIKAFHREAFYFEKRNEIIPFLLNIIRENDNIIVMGARDNSLNQFAKEIYNEIVKEAKRK